MKILLLAALAAASAFAQCGANGTLIINPLTGLWDCTGAAGGSGTVTSIATTSPITGGTITATGTIACATCVTSSVTQTADRILKGNGTKDTVVSGASIDSSDKGAFPGGMDLGTGSGKTGYELFSGATSGSIGITVADIGGTQILYVLPASVGSTDQVLTLDASTTCPTMVAGAPSNCRVTKWATGGSSGGGHSRSYLANTNMPGSSVSFDTNTKQSFVTFAGGATGEFVLPPLNDWDGSSAVNIVLLTLADDGTAGHTATMDIQAGAIIAGATAPAYNAAQGVTLTTTSPAVNYIRVPLNSLTVTGTVAITPTSYWHIKITRTGGNATGNVYLQGLEISY